MYVIAALLTLPMRECQSGVARLGVVGDEVAAGVAGEHQLAGRRQQPPPPPPPPKPPPAPGYGRRQTTLPVVGSIAVR